MLLSWICAWPLGHAQETVARPPWPDRPLSLADALDLALVQSPAIRMGQQDVEESQGIALQLKSAQLPRLTAGGAFQAIDDGRIEVLSGTGAGTDVAFQSDRSWNANILVSQPLYSGGRLRSQARSATLTRSAALAQFRAVVADALLEIKTSYDDVLLALAQIETQQASVALLEQELTDQKRRFDAGTAPRFNVLRAEVELANARPRLIRARNAHRIAKNNFATLLGWTIPTNTLEDIPLTLAGSLTADPYPIDMPTAIARGLSQRPELRVRETNERLREEAVVQARADYLPTLSVGAGWEWQSRTFTDKLRESVDGWTVGAQANWSLWDFGLTRGRVDAARAQRERARIETEDLVRQVEREVRTAYSNFIEAQEVLASQAKVIEQAEEAVRLATARNDAGTGTQLDLLSAQTALTEARTTQSEALRDYSVAVSRLQRAMGDDAQVQLAEGR